MLCPNIIPCSIKAFFYYLELCWERSLAALEACARTVLHLYSFPRSAPSLALLPLWVGRTRCMLLPLEFPFNFCLHHDSQERSAAASSTPWAGPPLGLAWGDAVPARALPCWAAAADQAWSLLLFAQGGSSQPRARLGHWAFCHVCFSLKLS